MQKVLVLAAALLGTAGPGFAQAPASASLPSSADQQAERRARYLANELGLTADQQTRLTPILRAQRQQLTALRDQAQAGGRRPGMGQELKASQASYTGQIRAVLTPEQFARFDQLRDEQRDNLRERRATGQGKQTRE